MNKSVIKIIKRNGKAKPENPQITTERLKTEKDIKLNIARIVNNWIDERRENSQRKKPLRRA
jgi:hypothetical protein